MSKILRYIASGIWVVLAIIVGTVFRQNIEEFAADRGFNAILTDGWQTMMGQGWALWVLFAFFFATGAMLALWGDYLLRPKSPFKATETKIRQKIAGKFFMNEAVRLDGKAFEGCTFRNVSLIYNGGRYSLIGNTFEGGIKLVSEVLEINDYMKLAGQLGMISVDMLGETGKIVLDGVTHEPAKAEGP